MRVRRAEHGDEGLLRELRVRALTEAPEAFSATIEQEHARTDAQLQRWFTGRSTVMILDDGGAAMGLTAVAPVLDAPTVASLLSMWVDPLARKRGGGLLLVETACKWARKNGYGEIRLHVYEPNTAARALYERTGFTVQGRRTPDPNRPDQLEMRRPL
ncbi:MAG TPA: GNAT family N-acetyltransferase [Acidimicrobiia bacterium]|nr:GNAT family N-acetyltransferase [Acidimicrobiia bacterium]